MSMRPLVLMLTVALLCAQSSLALKPTTQWFSEETVIYQCDKTCYDPGTGEPFVIHWEAAECQNSWWGICTPDSCDVSCRELYTGY